jgi:hypothetical protein
VCGCICSQTETWNVNIRPSCCGSGSTLSCRSTNHYSHDPVTGANWTCPMNASPPKWILHCSPRGHMVKTDHM